MKQTVIFFAIVIFLIISWLIGFIDDLNKDVATHIRSREDNIVITKTSNMTVNSNGEDVLLLSNMNETQKKSVWNSSEIKAETLELFPDFSEMKVFVDEHIEDDGAFKSKLLKKIEEVEFGYIGGELTMVSAKAKFMNF